MAFSVFLRVIYFLFIFKLEHMVSPPGAPGGCGDIMHICMCVEGCVIYLCGWVRER